MTSNSIWTFETVSAHLEMHLYYGIGSLFFSWLNRPTLWENSIVLTPLPTEGCLRCLQVLESVQGHNEYLYKCIFICTVKYLDLGLLGHVVRVYLQPYTTRKVFSSVAAPSCTPNTVTLVSSHPHCHSGLPGCWYSTRCMVTSHVAYPVSLSPTLPPAWLLISLPFFPLVFQMITLDLCM